MIIKEYYTQCPWESYTTIYVHTHIDLSFISTSLYWCIYYTYVTYTYMFIDFIKYVNFNI